MVACPASCRSSATSTSGLRAAEHSTRRSSSDLGREYTEPLAAAAAPPPPLPAAAAGAVLATVATYRGACRDRRCSLAGSRVRVADTTTLSSLRAPGCKNVEERVPCNTPGARCSAKAWEHLRLRAVWCDTMSRMAAPALAPFAREQAAAYGPVAICYTRAQLIHAPRGKEFRSCTQLALRG